MRKFWPSITSHVLNRSFWGGKPRGANQITTHPKNYKPPITPEGSGPRFCKPIILYHDCYMRRLLHTSWPTWSVLRASRWTVGGRGVESPGRSGGGRKGGGGEGGTTGRTMTGQHWRGRRGQGRILGGATDGRRGKAWVVHGVLGEIGEPTLRSSDRLERGGTREGTQRA